MGSAIDFQLASAGEPRLGAQQAADGGRGAALDTVAIDQQFSRSFRFHQLHQFVAQFAFQQHIAPGFGSVRWTTVTSSCWSTWSRFIEPPPYSLSEPAETHASRS